MLHSVYISLATIPQFWPFYRDPRRRGFQPEFRRNNIAFSLSPSLIPWAPNWTYIRPLLLASCSFLTSSPFELRAIAHIAANSGFPRDPSTEITPFFIPASSFTFHTFCVSLFLLKTTPSIRDMFPSLVRNNAKQRVPVEIRGSCLNKFQRGKQGSIPQIVIWMTLRWRLKDGTVLWTQMLVAVSWSLVLSKDGCYCERCFHFDIRVSQNNPTEPVLIRRDSALRRSWPMETSVYSARAIRLVTQFNLHPLLKLSRALFAVLSIRCLLHRVLRPLSPSSLCQWNNYSPGHSRRKFFRR